MYGNNNNNNNDFPSFQFFEDYNTVHDNLEISAQKQQRSKSRQKYWQVTQIIKSGLDYGLQ